VKLVFKVLLFAAISCVIYLLIATGLILSQWPSGKIVGEGLDFDRLTLNHRPIEPARYGARDGTQMNVRVRDGDGPLVVIVHGSGGHGAAYDWLAAQVALTGAEVLVPDLRGHFGADGARGDVDYIGQYEDDLADLIAQYRSEGQKVVLVGHSSGGGLVARFAGGSYGDMLDGAVLIAPFLKHDAPTNRQHGDGWARPLVRRIIGLSMLNGVGITLGNGATVMEFRVPDGPLAETMTSAYSFRLNASFAPRDDYLADLAALPRFQLIVGAEDEVFKAEAYEPLMVGVTDKGSYHILDGVSHLDVFLSADAVGLIAGFASGL
jgi:pimeloyl-ACP methyl ester carboxylesterase